MKTIYFLWIAVLLINCSVPKAEIEEINFEADACFGTCPIFTMTILNDGTATYNAKMYNKQQGQFRTTIRKEELDSLVKLIQHANLFSLQDNYTTGITDQPTYFLTVKQKNGQIKKIEDYGRNGPEQLRKIYKLIFSLRDSQNWK